MDFDHVVALATKHVITQLRMIGKHIGPKGPAAEPLLKKAILEAKGLQ